MSLSVMWDPLSASAWKARSIPLPRQSFPAWRKAPPHPLFLSPSQMPLLPREDPFLQPVGIFLSPVCLSHPVPMPWLDECPFTLRPG